MTVARVFHRAVNFSSFLQNNRCFTFHAASSDETPFRMPPVTSFFEYDLQVAEKSKKLKVNVWKLPEERFVLEIREKTSFGKEITDPVFLLCNSSDGTVRASFWDTNDERSSLDLPIGKSSIRLAAELKSELELIFKDVIKQALLELKDKEEAKISSGVDEFWINLMKGHITHKQKERRVDKRRVARAKDILGKVTKK